MGWPNLSEPGPPRGASAGRGQQPEFALAREEGPGPCRRWQGLMVGEFGWEDAH